MPVEFSQHDFYTSDRVSRLSKCKSDVSLVCVMVEYATAENSDLYKIHVKRLVGNLNYAFDYLTLATTLKNMSVAGVFSRLAIKTAFGTAQFTTFRMFSCKSCQISERNSEILAL